MNRVTEYLLSITAAAVICVVVKSIIDRKSHVGNMIAVISGVFMLITVLSPLLSGSLGDLGKYFDEFYLPGDDVALQAMEESHEEMKQIIKTQSEAYILEEAKRMSLNISVEVNVSDGSPPVPDSVTVTGNISPYKKEALSKYISDNFSIPQESLQWK